MSREFDLGEPTTDVADDKAGKKPKKKEPAQPPTLEEKKLDHKMKKEINLINKAFATFGVSVIVLLAVFIVSYFGRGNDAHVSEVIRILSTISTLALGFLFGANRKN